MLVIQQVDLLKKQTKEPSENLTTIPSVANFRDKKSQSQKPKDTPEKWLMTLPAYGMRRRKAGWAGGMASGSQGPIPSSWSVLAVQLFWSGSDN